MGLDIRHRYAALALLVVCISVALFYLQRRVHSGTSVTVTPYTAHFTVTDNRISIDGSSWNTVTTVVRARDRQGRTYAKTERAFQNDEQSTELFSFYVENPAKLQTMTWESNSKTVVIGSWPYWSGRQGCWVDEHGQNQHSFPTAEDWHKIPPTPGDGKLETIESITVGSGNRIKARVVSENLGHKDIHGLTAFGIRSTMTPLENGGPLAIPEITTEFWRSSDLDLKLLEVESGPKFGLKRMELSALQTGDPEPALFEPPKGYTVENIQYRQVACEQK